MVVAVNQIHVIIEMWKEDPGVGVHQVLGFRLLNKVLWSEMSFICLSPSERTALDSTGQPTQLKPI